MDKWIEEILKNAGKYIKDHQTEIKVGAGATIATGLASSMFWSDHEQKAVTEAEKANADVIRCHTSSKSALNDILEKLK